MGVLAHMLLRILPHLYFSCVTIFPEIITLQEPDRAQCVHGKFSVFPMQWSTLHDNLPQRVAAEITYQKTLRLDHAYIFCM